MTTLSTRPDVELSWSKWLMVGVVAAVASVVVVLLVQAAALSVWPEIARFAPLGNYLRTALFTLIPAFGATAVFAWLVARKTNPVQQFIRISLVVLLVSFIPDYVLPVPDRTLLASTVAAFLHVVAALTIVPVLVSWYRRMAR